MKEKFRREKVSDAEAKELFAKIQHPEVVAESKEVCNGILNRYTSKSSKTKELIEEFASYGRMYSF